jgi:hypothetical protein
MVKALFDTSNSVQENINKNLIKLNSLTELFKSAETVDDLIKIINLLTEVTQSIQQLTIKC